MNDLFGKEEPLIQVTAFNRNFYKVGYPVRVQVKGDYYFGIISDVHVYEIYIYTVEEKELVKKVITLGDIYRDTKLIMVVN